MATPDAAVASNPWAIPPGPTPVRGFAEFASGYTTGRSVNGATLYEDPALTPVFADAAGIRELTWKTQPQVGHLKGFVRDAVGQTLDTAGIEILRMDDGTSTGGGKDEHQRRERRRRRLRRRRPRTRPLSCAGHTCQRAGVGGGVHDVTAGGVTDLDLTVDRHLPVTTVAASASELWPPNGGTVTIGISGQAADVGTGLARIAVRVVDEYGDVEPTVPPIEVASAGAHAWEVSVPLVAARLDTDKDVGRTRLR
jgi:hypothetical protein